MSTLIYTQHYLMFSFVFPQSTTNHSQTSNMEITRCERALRRLKLPRALALITVVTRLLAVRD